MLHLQAFVSAECKIDIQDRYHPSMPATKQVSVRLPSDIAEQVEAKGATAPYIIAAVREKLQRDEQAEIAEGFALLAASPDLWDMDLPTGGQRAANEALRKQESSLAP